MEPRERPPSGSAGAAPARRNRVVHRLRGACERLLGPVPTAYLLHLRPMEWPIMTAHFLLGRAAGGGAAASAPGRPARLVRVRRPAQRRHPGHQQRLRPGRRRHRLPAPAAQAAPAPRPGLLPDAPGRALGLGFLLPPLFAWINAACVAMAVLYSVPPARLKSRAGWDMAINCIGFGLLTPLAGLGPHRPAPARLDALGGHRFRPACSARLYPPTQIYQTAEDRARGDRTLVIVLGEGPSPGPGHRPSPWPRTCASPGAPCWPGASPPSC